jgi:N-acetylglutamate synthase-like GNAT family acetyltransferase
MDIPPKKEEEKIEEGVIESRVHENDISLDFEKTKEDFSNWTNKYLEDLYFSEKKITSLSFNDPVTDEVMRVTNKSIFNIAKEEYELCKIFIKNLIYFCNRIIFEDFYSQEKYDIFQKNIAFLFLKPTSRAILPFVLKPEELLVVSSEINESYGLSNISSEYMSFSFNLLSSLSGKDHLDYLKKEIKNFNKSNKISAIKQLSISTNNALSRGVTFHNFEFVKELLLEIKEKDESPLVSFVADFELSKIKTDQLDDDYYSDDKKNTKDEKTEKTKKDIEINLIKESVGFFSKKSTLPSLDKVWYTRVSKDFGAIVIENNHIPIALVDQNDSKENKETKLKNYDGLTSDKNINPFDEGEDFSRLIKLLHTPEIRSYINDRFSIKIEDFFLKEQIHFLRFLANADRKTFERLEDRIKIPEEKDVFNFVKSFLSMSGDVDMGIKIIELSENMPIESSKNVFAKYAEIIETADMAEETIKTLLPPETFSASRNILRKISESLLVRAKEMLISYHDKKDISEKDVLLSLERFKTEILLYADTYKELKKEGVIFSLEDLDQTKITELSLEERKEMSDELWEITKTNREKFITDPVSMKKREERFRHSLDDSNVEFLTLKHKENIIAFCSLEKDKEGKYLIESLNVESQIKGSNIGGAFLPSVIKDCLEKGKEVYGYVHNGNKGTLPYYERIGFSVSEVEKDGELFYEIRIKPN